MKPLLILTILLSNSVFAWDDIDKDFALLDTGIRHMWSGGAWQQDKKEGFYRILIAGGGYEHYKTKMYVQWVTHGTDIEVPKVLKTIEIKELNENPVYSFNLPSCTGGWQCSSVSLSATHTYNLTEYEFKINFIGIGKYKFTANTL